MSAKVMFLAMVFIALAFAHSETDAQGYAIRENLFGQFGRHRAHKRIHRCAHGHFKRKHNFRPLLINKPNLDPTQFSLLKRTKPPTPDYATRKIRINLEPIGMESVDPNLQTYLLKTILGEVKDFFQNLLSVNGPTKIPAFNTTGCFDDKYLPRKFTNSQTDTDLILFVTAADIQEEVFAYATSCLLSDYDYRPLVGLVVVNTKHLELNPWNIEVGKSTLMHEIMHVLVFDPQLFNLFPIGVGKVYQIESRTTLSGTYNATKVILPSVVEFGRKYYGCNKLSGVYLEDEGGEGSVGAHWEKYYFGNELMTAESTGDGILSGFTIGLLKDCGWYRVNETLTEYFSFGRGAGCEFLGTNCNPALPEFCPLPNRLQCNRDRTTKTFCIISQFTDKCPVSLPIPELDCTSLTRYIGYTDGITDEPGPHARCVDVRVQKVYQYAACFRIECKDNKTFFVYPNGVKTLCQKKGQVIPDGPFDYICPGYDEVCQTLPCSNKGMCSGNGKCLETGDCYCNYFYGGSDCSHYRGCHNDDMSICPLIAPTGHSQPSDPNNQPPPKEPNKPPKKPDDGDDDSDESDDRDIDAGDKLTSSVLLFLELGCMLTLAGFGTSMAQSL